MFEAQTGQWVAKTETERKTARVGYLVAAAILGTALLLGSGYLIGHAPVAGLKAAKSKLQTQLRQSNQRGDHDVVILQATIVALQRSKQFRCVSYDSDIANMERLINKGNFAAAAALADLDLSNLGGPPCSGGLAKAWYVASLDALLSTPPSSGVDTTVVQQWEGINARADELGVDSTQRESPMTIFVLSFDNRL